MLLSRPFAYGQQICQYLKDKCFLQELLKRFLSQGHESNGCYQEENQVFPLYIPAQQGYPADISGM